MCWLDKLTTGATRDYHGQPKARDTFFHTEKLSTYSVIFDVCWWLRGVVKDVVVWEFIGTTLRQAWDYLWQDVAKDELANGNGSQPECCYFDRCWCKKVQCASWHWPWDEIYGQNVIFIGAWVVRGSWWDSTFPCCYHYKFEINRTTHLWPGRKSAGHHWL